MTGLIDFSKLSLREAIEVAITVEDKAKARYESLAEAMNGQSESAVAAFFREMARQEAKHGRALRDRRTALFGDEPRTINPASLPAVEGPAAEEDPSDARQALSTAKLSEVRAYEFYTTALVGIVDEDVRELLEDLRSEEIGHKLMVQEQIDRLDAAAKKATRT